VIRKALFLIGNIHFLIRKWHFGIGQAAYVGRWSVRQRSLLSYQELQMIRRRLLIAATVIASVVLAACSDMTGPKNDVCPIINGSSTCLTH
jgi:predicted small secreted protein